MASSSSSPLLTPSDRPAVSPAPSRVRLIDFKEVVHRTGLSHTTIKRLIRAGKFPVRVKIGNMTRWDADAVDRWIDDAIAAANDKRGR